MTIRQTRKGQKPSSPSYLPPFLKVTPEGVVLKLRVQPGAKRTDWAGLYGPELKVMVQSPPVEGAANQGCLTFLVHCFGVKKSEVVLLKGAKSRSKVFLIKGLTLKKCLPLIPGQNQDLLE